jgi:Cu(I)/Ag(I) efflux system membrane fusion protein
VSFNETSTYKVTPYANGVIKRLYAQWPGQYFAPGQVLYEIYSQDLLLQQYEYIDYHKRVLQSLRAIQQTRESNRRALEEASQDPQLREQTERAVRQSTEQLATMEQSAERDGQRLSNRLRFAGFTDDMLAELAKSGRAFDIVPVRAKRPCLVKEINPGAGSTVDASTQILVCADLSTAWVDVALYPDQQPWVKRGDAVRLRLPDGAVQHSRLELPSPILDGASRVLRGRVTVTNPGQLLKPGAVLDVTIDAAPRQALAIPRSALIRTGREDVVMLARADGHFLAVPVEIGIETDELVEIRSGLQAGAQVAVNGHFLLDAAASMAATAARLRGGGSAPH